MATPASHTSLSAWLSACLTSRSCFARATPAFWPSMSASIFARTAVQFLTAVSPTDLISCFTFSVAFAAAARACSLRASILSCASFSAAATASSAFLARTDKSASCWESGLAMYFLHRYLCARPRLWRSDLLRMAHVLWHECVRKLFGGDGHHGHSGPRARRSGGVGQYLANDRVADEPHPDDGISSAAAALALRASAELLRIARRPCPTHGLPPAPLFLGMGGGIDCQELDDSLAVWNRTHLADRREGCG